MVHMWSMCECFALVEEINTEMKMPMNKMNGWQRKRERQRDRVGEREIVSATHLHI